MLFKDKLSDIIRTLENDGLLLCPTDTSWELVCSIQSSKAITKLNLIKNRKAGQPYTLLIDSIIHLKKYVPHIHPRIETLLHFHKKPLTIVFSNVKHVPSFAMTYDEKVAFRIISDPYCNEIIKLLGVPLISESVNLDSQSLPFHFNDISKKIIENVDYISKHKRNFEFNTLPAVTINYNDEGAINFLTK